jgi:3,4-dihydroxy 2-butanone 4-phosphate synthase/GTP cyclohydrolase II
LSPNRRALAEATDELGRGRPAIVHNGREAVFVLPLAEVSPRAVAFLVRHGSGLLVAALPPRRCDELSLPRMWGTFEQQSDYCVTVDASDGITTGISATDRATTLSRLADPSAVPADFQRPGHVMTRATHPEGVTARAGFPEAAADLAELAHRGRPAVYTHVVSPVDATRLAKPGEWDGLRGEWLLPAVSLAMLRGFRAQASGLRRLDGRLAAEAVPRRRSAGSSRSRSASPRSG